MTHVADDDATLVRAAQAGDDQAFAAIVVRHTPRLYRVALHIVGDRSDAEDCVQEAWISAWRHLPGYRSTAAVSTWLYRITTNAALMRVRRRHLTVDLDRVAEPAAQGAYGDPERSTATVTVRRALLALRPEHRTVIVLREFEGLRYEQLAAVLGLSVPAARSRLHRARLALTELLEE